MKALLLIPAFDEERTIRDIVTTARQFMDDILVVDDGSVDKTKCEASAAGALVHRLEQNHGKGDALKTGFAYALDHGYDLVITIDADGQHDPEDLRLFLPVAEQFDLVLGNRFEAHSFSPFLRRLANRASSRIVSTICGQRIHDSQTGFRSYSSRLIRNVQLTCSHYDLETEVIIKAAQQGFRIGHCRIRTIYGSEVSRFKNVKDSVRFFQVILRTVLTR
jgi:glycosyltransferase involved in cell wall biosynthesis